MKSFLEYVAEDIKHKYGEKMGRTAIIFPNKRTVFTAGGRQHKIDL